MDRFKRFSGFGCSLKGTFVQKYVFRIFEKCLPFSRVFFTLLGTYQLSKFKIFSLYQKYKFEKTRQNEMNQFHTIF